MANPKYGETTWDEEKSGKDDFDKLKDGTNLRRVITKPHKFSVHRVKLANDPNKKGGGGRTIRCAVNNCPLCKLANGNVESVPAWAKDMTVDKAKPRWYVGVINRDVNPNVAKTLEIGSLIRNKVKSYAQNKKWGDPTTYDVEITKDPNADSPVNFYDVVPDPTNKGPLSPEDLKLLEGFDMERLAQRCEPFTEEQIIEAANRYREWVVAATTETGKSNGKQQATAPATRQVAEDGPAPSAVEDDFNFKSSKES